MKYFVTPKKCCFWQLLLLVVVATSQALAGCYKAYRTAHPQRSDHPPCKRHNQGKQTLSIHLFGTIRYELDTKKASLNHHMRDTPILSVAPALECVLSREK